MYVYIFDLDGKELLSNLITNISIDECYKIGDLIKSGFEKYGDVVTVLSNTQLKLKEKSKEYVNNNNCNNTKNRKRNKTKNRSKRRFSKKI